MDIRLSDDPDINVNDAAMLTPLTHILVMHKLDAMNTDPMFSQSVTRIATMLIRHEIVVTYGVLFVCVVSLFTWIGLYSKVLDPKKLRMLHWLFAPAVGMYVLFLSFIGYNNRGVIAELWHQSPLTIAVLNDDFLEMRRLLKSGVDPNMGSPAPLFVAVAKHNRASIDLLIRSGAKENPIENKTTPECSVLFSLAFEMHPWTSWSF